MRASIYARRITTETGLEWRLRRLRNNTARHLMIFARRFRDAGKPVTSRLAQEELLSSEPAERPAGNIIASELTNP